MKSVKKTLEFFFLIKNITAGKVKNLLLLRVSFILSFFSKKCLYKGNPAFLSIEPADFCNLRCPECPTGNGIKKTDKKKLSIDSFNTIIDVLSPDLISVQLYFQGEPYLNASLFDMIAYADKKNIFTVTSTNGHFLHDEYAKKTVESGLKKIIVSMDGITQESYETYRVGGKLDKVYSGIENLVKWKKKLNSSTPIIELQFLVLSSNEFQIREAKKTATSLNIDYISFKTAQFYSFENGNVLMPENKKYNRYEQTKAGYYRRKKKIQNKCWKNWSSVVINIDGEMLPCCFDKLSNHAYGNMLDNSDKCLWKGKKAYAFKKQILHNRKSIPICTNCSE